MLKGWVVAMLLVLTTPAVSAVEVAPRISDREIIESLAELKAGQKALEERMDHRFVAIEGRFDQRFVSMEKRFAFVENLMLVTITGIFGLIGYIVWDRKTALRPVEERLTRMESELHRDLEIRHEGGSIPTRLVKALRELAKKDERLAGVLRSFSLL